MTGHSQHCVQTGASAGSSDRVQTGASAGFSDWVQGWDLPIRYRAPILEQKVTFTLVSERHSAQAPSVNTAQEIETNISPSPGIATAWLIPPLWQIVYSPGTLLNKFSNIKMSTYWCVEGFCRRTSRCWKGWWPLLYHYAPSEKLNVLTANKQNLLITSQATSKLAFQYQRSSGKSAEKKSNTK